MMSEGMPVSSSWRYLNSASSRFSSFRGYWRREQPPTLTNEMPNERQGWRAWAGQKIKLKTGTSNRDSSGMETITLFPGWAARSYRKVGSNELGEAFEVDVFVSGFASSHRESASRSQRAFIRLAKGFASLPKLTADALSPETEPLKHLSPSTEALLAQIKLPPRPTEITEEYEIEALERQLRRAKTEVQDPESPGSSRSSSVDLTEHPPDIDATPRPRPPPEYRNPAMAIPVDVLRQLHANLESRLRPFWSSVLGSRVIRVHLFASPHHPVLPSRTDSEDDQDSVNHGPVASQDVTTLPDGSFQARFRVKWEDLCQHPGALHIAFGDKSEEHELLVAAHLLPVVATPPSSASSASSISSGSESHSQIRPASLFSERDLPITPPTTIRISITHSPIRVISDIDDTIKLSNILSGARAVFHNVFVKDLQDNIIPGMGEWYSEMWSRGIRFHYVSNGPFELLPVVSEFFQISQLPPGSIKLKSYAGRSLFNGLLSAPAIRKRAGVVDILDSFPDSRFFLIGDTGEQDLELYADLARERPDQILAVLVRDVETGDPIADPTGWKAIGAAGTRSDPLVPSPSVDDTPRPRRTLSDMLSTKGSLSASKASTPSGLNVPENGTSGGDYFTTKQPTAEPEMMATAESARGSRFITYPAVLPSPAPSFMSKASRSSTSSSSLSIRMTDEEKKRHTLQARVYRARTQMPGHIPLRIFRDPAECVEADEILEKEPLLGGKS